MGGGRQRDLPCASSHKGPAPSDGDMWPFEWTGNTESTEEHWSFENKQMAMTK